MTHFIRFAAPAMLAFVAVPAAAQDSDAPPASNSDSAEPMLEGGVFDGDWLTVGIGAGYVPSYDGSDDYVFTPLPLVQGSIGGVGISPRPAGLALDLIDDGDSPGASFALGPTARIRSNRDGQIEDPVVESLGDLDTAIELGVSAGVSIPGVLHGFDSLSLSTDVRWDVAGAHDGMTIAPSISYLTPLSRGTAVILSVSAEYADDDFMDYYYSVSAADAATSGLAPFQAEGGFRSVGTNLLVAQDLNGNVLDGGLSLFGIAGYSRLLGDAADSPFTADRGSADQFLGALGIAYTF